MQPILEFDCIHDQLVKTLDSQTTFNDYNIIQLSYQFDLNRNIKDLETAIKIYEIIQQLSPFNLNFTCKLDQIKQQEYLQPLLQLITTFTLQQSQLETSDQLKFNLLKNSYQITKDNALITEIYSIFTYNYPSFNQNFQSKTAISDLLYQAVCVTKSQKIAHFALTLGQFNDKERNQLQQIRKQFFCRVDQLDLKLNEKHVFLHQNPHIPRYKLYHKLDLIDLDLACTISDELSQNKEILKIVLKQENSRKMLSQAQKTFQNRRYHFLFEKINFLFPDLPHSKKEVENQISSQFFIYSKIIQQYKKLLNFQETEQILELKSQIDVILTVLINCQQEFVEFQPTWDRLQTGLKQYFDLKLDGSELELAISEQFLLFYSLPIDEEMAQRAAVEFGGEVQGLGEQFTQKYAVDGTDYLISRIEGFLVKIEQVNAFLEENKADLEYLMQIIDKARLVDFVVRNQVEKDQEQVENAIFNLKVINGN